MHWPKGFKAKGELRDQYNHCIDIVLTVYECLGIELPPEVQGLHPMAAGGDELQVQLRQRPAPLRDREERGPTFDRFLTLALVSARFGEMLPDSRSPPVGE